MVMSCNVCGGAFETNQLTHMCGNCHDNLQADLSQVRKHNEQLAFDLERARGSRGGEVKDLSFKLDKAMKDIEYLKVKLHAAEKAQTESAANAAEVTRQNSELREICQVWKLAHQHETSGRCPCSSRKPCPELARLKEVGIMGSPGYECPRCKINEPIMAEMRKTLETWGEWRQHFARCKECGPSKLCLEAQSLMDEAYSMTMRAVSSSAGANMLRQLKDGLRDFSFIGDGGGLILLNGYYNVVRIDMEEIREKNVDLKLLGVGETPKQAVEKYRESMKKGTVHVAQ